MKKFLCLLLATALALPLGAIAAPVFADPYNAVAPEGDYPDDYLPAAPSDLPEDHKKSVDIDAYADDTTAPDEDDTTVADDDEAVPDDDTTVAEPADTWWDDTTAPDTWWDDTTAPWDTEGPSEPIDIVGLYSDAPILSERERTYVEYRGTAASGAFRFVPSATRNYEIYSENAGKHYDTYVTVYDEDGNYVAGDDDNGNENNFYLNIELEEGKTYFILSRGYSANSSGDFYLCVCPILDIVSLSVSVKDDAALTPGLTSGDWDWCWDEENETEVHCYWFNDYAVFQILEVTATFEDGTSGPVSSNRFGLESSAWLDGEVEFEVRVYAYDSDAQATVGVPVTAFADRFGDAPLLTAGEAASYPRADTWGDVAFRFVPDVDSDYYFSTSNYAYVAIYSEDGEHLAGSDYRVRLSLEAGKTYYVMTAYGEDDDGALTVTRINSITALSLSLTSPDAALTFGWDGWWDGYYDEEIGDYVRYYAFSSSEIFSILEVNATFDDGTSAVLNSEDRYFYGIDYDYDTRHWTVGGEENTFTVYRWYGDDKISASINVPVISLADRFGDAPLLTVGEAAQCPYTETRGDVVFRFVPELDSEYVFSTSTYRGIYVYSEDGECLADIGGYSARVRLEADKTYYIITYYGDEYDCEITVESIKSITALSLALTSPDAALTAGWDGWCEKYYDEEIGDYVKYYGFDSSAIFSILEVTAAFDDGTSAVLNEEDRYYYGLDYDCESRYWTVGGEENTFTVYRWSDDDEIAASINIPMISLADRFGDAPLLTIGEATQCPYTDTRGDVVFRFVPEFDSEYVFSTYRDIWVYSEEGEYLESNSYRTRASLEAGKTYYVFTAYGLHDDCEITVESIKTITELSLSLASPDAALTIGLDGWWGQYYNEEIGDYVRYYAFDSSEILSILEVTATFDDGTSAVLNSEDRSYYGVYCEYDSGYWTVGGENNTFTVYRWYGDNKISASINVPVISLEDRFCDAPLLTVGEAAQCPYTDNWGDVVFRFVPEFDSEYVFSTSSYRDIWVYSEEGEYLESNSNRVRASLEAGKTYYIFTAYGSHYDCEITVESIKTITALSLSLTSPDAALTIGLDGWWDGYYNEEIGDYVRYYQFNWDAIYSILELTATFDDGTSAVLNEEERYFYGIDVDYDPRCWSAGGEDNTLTVYRWYGDDKISASINVPVISLADRFGDAPLLTVGEAAQCPYTETRGDVAFRFVPEFDSEYVFSTSVYRGIYVYSEDGECLADIGGYNARVRLEADKTYYILAYYGDDYDCEITVESIKSITALSLALKSPDAALTIGWDSDWGWYWDDETGSEVRYNYFDSSAIFSILELTATFDDGTSAVLNEEDRSHYGIDYYNNSRYWTAGGEDNIFTVYRWYGDDKISASINVPVVSLADRFGDAPILTYEGAFVKCDPDAEWGDTGVLLFTPGSSGEYEIWTEGGYNTDIVAYSEDGYVVTDHGWGSAVGDHHMYATLEAGKTYVVVTHGGGSGEYNVYAAPVTEIVSLSLSLTSPDAVLVEGISDGSWDCYWDEKDYYYFYWSAIRNIIKVVATFDDGIEAYVSGNRVSFDYDCREWTAGGNANTVTVSTASGVSATISIPVQTVAQYYADAPVLETDVPVSLNGAGTWSEDVFRFIPETSARYVFETSDQVRILIYDEDNNSLCDVNYNVVSLDLEAGNTYFICTKNAEGCTLSVTQLKEIMALSVALKPNAVLTTGFDNGSWGTYYGEDVYYFSESAIFSILEITATFSDGTSAVVSPDYYALRCSWGALIPGENNPVDIWCPGDNDDVVATINVPVQTMGQRFCDAPLLTVGEDAQCLHTESLGDNVFRFIPETSGAYSFTATDKASVFLYDEIGRKLDRGSVVRADLEAGKTYIVMSLFGDADEYTLTAANSKSIAALSLSLKPDAVLTEDLSYGYWSTYWDEGTETEVDYYRFELDAILPLVNITVTFDDGTTETFGYYDEYREGEYSFNYGSYYNISWNFNQTQWTPGGENNEFTLYIYDSDISATVNVPVQTLEDYYENADVCTPDSPVDVVRHGEREATIITVPQSGEYYVCTQNSEDAYVQLVDENGSEVSVNGDYTTPSDIILLYTLEAGKRYVFYTVMPCVAEGETIRVTVSAAEPDDVCVDGHNPGDAHEENRVEATCGVEGGYDIVTRCTVCGQILTSEHKTIPALSHDWSAWTEITPATNDADGVERHTCSNCGKSEDRAIPKLAVAWGDVNEDGAVDILDAIQIAQYTVTKSVTIGECADVNRDGAIDILDVIMIAQYTIDKTIVLGVAS